MAAPLASYREPFGGHWVVFASLPIDKVDPTPYQRELSKAHAERLAGVIPKVGRFLDPVIAVVDGDKFITPNGMHRLNAMRTLGAKAITALVLPEPEIAFRILALNTEKAHNLRDKALEVVRMARALVADPAQAKRPETDFALEFENAAFLTIGFCYEKNGRFSGGAYQSVVSRCDALREQPLIKTLPEREELAAQLLDLDEHVNEAVEAAEGGRLEQRLPQADRGRAHQPDPVREAGRRSSRSRQDAREDDRERQEVRRVEGEGDRHRDRRGVGWIGR